MQSIGTASSNAEVDPSKEEMSLEKKIGIACAVLVLLVFIGFGVWYYLDSKKTHINGNVFNIAMMAQLGDRAGYAWRNPAMHTLLLYRGLLSSDGHFENVYPDIAESYEVSDDGLTYTFKIGEDERWSDGSPIIAEDVEFSLRAVLVAKNVNSNFPIAFNKIKGAEAYKKDPSIPLEGVKTDGKTVIINLDIPHQPLLQMFAQLAIYPKHGFTELENLADIEQYDFWKTPIVNGMYKFVGSVEDKYSLYVPNEYYSGKKPKIDEVRFVSNFRIQDMDIYSTNNISEMVQLSSFRDFRKYDVNILFYRYFIFNIKGNDGHYNEAMDNLLLREAIASAINRKQLLYDIYFNAGELINSGVPNNHVSNDGFAFEYNPERARQLLRDSGYDLTRPLRIAYYYSDELSISFLNAVAVNLREIGFTVELIKSNGAFLYNTREYDIGLKGLSALNYIDWYSEYSSTNRNFANIFGAEGEYDELINTITTATDSKDVHQALHDLQALEHSQLKKIPLFTLGQAFYINERRISKPDDVVFGNTWYRSDFRFEEWEVKRR